MKRILGTILLAIVMVFVMSIATVYADPGDAGNQNQSVPPSPPVVEHVIQVSSW